MDDSPVEAKELTEQGEDEIEKTLPKFASTVEDGSGRSEESEEIDDGQEPADALAAQLKRRLEIVQRKGEKVAWEKINLDAENKELKQKIDELQKENEKKTQEIQSLKEILRRYNIPVQDSEDGAASNEQPLSTSGNVAQNILSSLSTTLAKFHKKFHNPFKCPASCVMSSMFFLLTLTTKTSLCSFKFITEIQRRKEEINVQLHNLTQDDDQDGNGAQECSWKWEECSASLRALAEADLIFERPCHSSAIIDGAGALNDALQIASKAMLDLSKENGDNKRTFYSALIVVEYKAELSKHCMVITQYRNKSNKPERLEVFDVKSGRLWQNVDPNIVRVHSFKIYRMNEEVAKEIKEKCRFHLCRLEHEAAGNSTKITGVLDGFFEELQSCFDAWIDEQLDEIE